MANVIYIRLSKDLRINYSKFYAHLAQAADDIKLGRTQDIDAAFDDILSSLDEIQVMDGISDSKAYQIDEKKVKHYKPGIDAI